MWLGFICAIYERVPCVSLNMFVACCCLMLLLNALKWFAWLSYLSIYLREPLVGMFVHFNNYFNKCVLPTVVSIYS